MDSRNACAPPPTYRLRDRSPDCKSCETYERARSNVQLHGFRCPPCRRPTCPAAGVISQDDAVKVRIARVIPREGGPPGCQIPLWSSDYVDIQDVFPDTRYVRFIVLSAADPYAIRYQPLLLILV